jgi:hypothetical protein
MSRLAREYPDATHDELFDLGLRASVPYLKEGEPRYRYECRSCGDEMWLNQKDHDTREMNKLLGRGFTIPKCGDCWN